MALNLEGLIPATIVPMTADAEIDEEQLRRYIRWVSEQGPVALAINADTGEGPHLTHREKVRVIEIVADELNGALPIVAGIACFTAPMGFGIPAQHSLGSTRPLLRATIS